MQIKSESKLFYGDKRQEELSWKTGAKAQNKLCFMWNTNKKAKKSALSSVENKVGTKIKRHNARMENYLYAIVLSPLFLRRRKEQTYKSM